MGIDTFNVEVKEELEPEITGEAMICFGNTTTLSLTQDFATYNWSTESQEASIIISESGQYIVTVTDDMGCMGIDTFNVEVKEALVPELIGLTDICFEDTLTISLNQEYSSYLWSTGDTTASIQISTQGDYGITVTNEEGCIGIDSFEVRVEEVQVPEILGGDMICEGDTLQLSVNAPFDRFEWSTGDIGTTIGVIQPGLYSVSATNENGCTSYAEIEVEMMERPTPLIMGDDILCGLGGTILSLEDVENLVVFWSEISGQDNVQITFISRTAIEVKTPGIFQVEVFGQNGCVGVDTIEIIRTPDINIQILGVVNPGENNLGSIEIEVNGGTAPYTFSWFDAEGNKISSEQNIDSLEVGTYNVLVEDANGCLQALEQIEVGMVTDVSNLENEKGFRIYPIPANNDFYIINEHRSKNAFEGKLLNITGEIIKVFNIESWDKAYRLDVADLPGGSYFIYLNNAETHIWKKVMIQK